MQRSGGPPMLTSLSSPRVFRMKRKADHRVVYNLKVPEHRRSDPLTTMTGKDEEEYRVGLLLIDTSF